MQKSIQVENAKKAAATAVLTGTFGMTVADSTQDNVLVVECTQEQWDLFDAANKAAATANASEVWASLKTFGGIAKTYGLAALKGAGSATRGIINVLGSEVTITTLTEVAHVGTTGLTTLGEVALGAGAATLNTFGDEAVKAYNRLKVDENVIGLGRKAVAFANFLKNKNGTTGGLW